MLQLKYKNSEKGPLWLVEKRYRVGSDPTCDVKLTRSDAPALAAEFLVEGDRVSLVVPGGASGVDVNGETVTGTRSLTAGDVVHVDRDSFELVDPKDRKVAAVDASGQTAWSLKALNTALENKFFPLEGSCVLGRSKECDISLAVVHLSRRHARVSVTDAGLKVEDLGSSNGTFINGKKVQSGLALAGDEICFDTLRFRVSGPTVDVDEDRTSVRPVNEEKLTTVRPALNSKPSQDSAGVRQPIPAQAHRSSARAGASKRAVPRSQETEASTAVDTTPENAGLGVVWVVLAVLLGAAVAWVVLT